MLTINANHVDSALEQGLALLRQNGVWQNSRNGDVLVAPCPVMTINQRPMQRVSLSAKRNANPFFHLMEALWMLAGRNDSEFLNGFVGDFGKRFAETDGHLHGAYGFRWRCHFDLDAGGDAPVDQLDKAVELLKANPDDRRVVIAMWDPMSDLGVNLKDIPCNTHIYLRVRAEALRDYGGGPPGPGPASHRVLDLTVCCRSNDAVWGCHGANAVHFSVLQEYLAARIGVEVGVMYQLSNNYHVYRDIYNQMYPLEEQRNSALISSTRIVTKPEDFDSDLHEFFDDNWLQTDYNNDFLTNVAVPLRRSYALWREGNREKARQVVHAEARPCDWAIAAGDWYDRKMHKQLA